MSFSEKTNPTRVLIVDSHLLVAELITGSLPRGGSFQVAGEVATGAEGLRFFQKYHPSLVITALELGEISGPEMIRRMQALSPEVRIVVCTGSQKRDLLYAALEADPQGFVHKTEGLIVFHQALEMVVRGMSYRSPYVTELLSRKRQESQEGDRLTDQERTLVRLIAEGMSTKQIADQLRLSPKTVENYRKQLTNKLGLDGIAALTRYALRCGLVE